MYIFKKKWMQILLIVIVLLILGWNQIISTYFLLAANFHCSQTKEGGCLIRPEQIQLPVHTKAPTQNYNGLSFYLPNSSDFTRRSGEGFTLEREHNGARILLNIHDGYTYFFTRDFDTINLNNLEITPGETNYFHKRSNESVVNLLAYDPSNYLLLETKFNTFPSKTDYFQSSKRKIRTATLLFEKQIKLIGHSKIYAFSNQNVKGFILFSDIRPETWNIYLFHQDSRRNPDLKNNILAFGFSKDEILEIISSFEYTN